MRYLYLVILSFVLLACKHKTTSEPDDSITTEEIVNKAIEKSGGNAFSNSQISFDFRKMSYGALRRDGLFQLERNFKNNINDSVRDVLTNDAFHRYINGKKVVLGDSLAALYTASVNSVHYFSVLPYGLNDNAVNKSLIGQEVIKDRSYYKIKVTFNEQGGGEDYEDVFVYWISKVNFETDYLAYSYSEADGKGLRFREAYNERNIKGLRFVDYRNYKPKSSDISVLDLGNEFSKGKLDLVSVIELKNISVTLFQ